MRRRIATGQLCRPTKCEQGLSAFPQSSLLVYTFCSTLTVAFPPWFDAPVVNISDNSSIFFHAISRVQLFQARNMKYIQKNKLFRMLIPAMFIPTPRVVLCDRINGFPECFIDGPTLGVDAIPIST